MTTNDGAPQVKEGQADWSEWWSLKKKNNQDLIVAAEKGDLDQFKALLDQDSLKDLAAEINARTEKLKWHSLHKASFYGRSNIIDFLLSHKTIDLFPLTITKQSCFMLACWHNHVSIAR